MIFEFIINILVIWGVRFLFAPGELLGGLNVWLTKVLIRVFPSKVDDIKKPLFDCTICMSSIWSIPFYVHNYVHHDFSWYYWPVYALSLAGANHIIGKFLTK